MDLKSTWQLSNLPHKKLATRGAFSLSNIELLSLLLRCQKPKQEDVNLARQLLFSTGNKISHIVKFSYKQLVHELKLKESSAMAIVAALELGRRIQSEKDLSNYFHIKKIEQVQALMRPHLQGLAREECWILLLNEKKYLLNKHRMFVGGIEKLTADVRIVLRHIVQEPTCNHFIIIHNHPANDTQPSKADITFTEKMLVLAEIMDCVFVDHIIYTDSAVLSLRKTSLIKNINFQVKDKYLL